MNDASSPARSNVLHDLRLSIVLLAVIVLFALGGLALDGNWPKLLRVSLSFVAYASVLLGFAKYRSKDAADTYVPFAWFALAGAAAGIVSGLVRPVFDWGVLIVGAIAAGLLLAGIHCLALRQWRNN